MLHDNFSYSPIAENDLRGLSKQTDTLDEKSQGLSTQTALADKYVTLVFEMPVYEQFDSLLVNIPAELRDTTHFWQKDTKPVLMNTVTAIRSFCSSYISYFPDLLDALNQGIKTIDSEKNNLLEFINELLPMATTASESIAQANRRTIAFSDKVQNHNDKLRSKVIPNIEKTMTSKVAEFVANKEALESIEGQINAAEAQFMQAVYGAAGSAASLGVTAGVHTLKKPAGKLAAKVIPKFVGKLAGKLAGKLGGRVVPGLELVLIGVEIIGFIASVALMAKFKREMQELRAKKSSYLQKSIDLEADVSYLTAMQTAFEKLLQQGMQVNSAFNNLSTAWYSLQASMQEINEKLRTLDTKLLEKRLLFMKGAMHNLNKEFSTLNEKLQRYEIGFVLPVSLQDENTALTRRISYHVPTLLIPSPVYACL
jgi:DNA repair exonuclease SbcCD ATPase subunit